MTDNNIIELKENINSNMEKMLASGDINEICHLFCQANKKLSEFYRINIDRVCDEQEEKLNKIGIIVHDTLFANITATECFYRYKNIRMYRLLKNDNVFLTYWTCVLILDENSHDSGRLLPCLDIRTLPTWKNDISTFVLCKEPQRIIPKLFREAIKKNYITDDMFVDWTIDDDKYLIEDI